MTEEWRNTEEKAQSRLDARYFRDVVIMRSAGHCEACDLDCTPIIQVHHFVPVKNGGDGLPSNLVALCPNCHEFITKFETVAGSKNDERFAEYLDGWMRAHLSPRHYEMLASFIMRTARYEDGKWLPGPEYDAEETL